MSKIAPNGRSSLKRPKLSQSCAEEEEEEEEEGAISVFLHFFMAYIGTFIWFTLEYV
jgi:hypothetical protein